MWTATLVSYGIVGFTWTYVIAYSDGKGNSYDLSYTADVLTDAVINQTAATYLNQINKVTASGQVTLQVGAMVGK